MRIPVRYGSTQKLRGIAHSVVDWEVRTRLPPIQIAHYVLISYNTPTLSLAALAGHTIYYSHSSSLSM